MSGRQITEGRGDSAGYARSIAVELGIGTGNIWQNTGIHYDLAINAMPFIAAISDERPYIRQTAPFRKEQFDNSAEPGEQSLTGWWLRSQSSFHYGAGIKFYEPAQDESLKWQFNKSKGVDVWTKGQVTLLNDTTQVTTSSISTSATKVITANDGTNDCFLVTDNSALKKVTLSTDTPTVSTYTQAGTASTIYSITTDGARYWFINGTHVHRGNVGGTTSDTEIYAASSTTSAVIKYVKQRVIAAINNKLYELDPAHIGGGALPADFYKHSQTDWTWTAISESPQAIYVAGKNRTSSSIYKIGLDVTNANALGFPDLEVPTVTVTLPDGEYVNGFDIYLGSFVVICTNKGVRVGIVNADGDISYGPLLFNEAECFSVAFRDKFAYVATKIGGEAGVVRIDLTHTVEDGGLIFPWAWDLVASNTTSSAISIAFLGTTDRLGFIVSGGGLYFEKNAEKVASGYLQTGFVRYNTLEDKNFKRVSGRGDLTYGSISLQSRDEDDNLYDIITYSAAVGTPEARINQPTGPKEFLGLRFVLTRDATDSTKSPIFTGYQLKSVPATPRNRLIRIPVFCYDTETDKYDVQIGYEDRAYERLAQLESIEQNGDIVTFQDFRVNETFQCLIEEVQFTSQTPPDKRFTGFGGIIQLTIRTV